MNVCFVDWQDTRRNVGVESAITFFGWSMDLSLLKLAGKGLSITSQNSFNVVFE